MIKSICRGRGAKGQTRNQIRMPGDTVRLGIHPEYIRVSRKGWKDESPIVTESTEASVVAMALVRRTGEAIGFDEVIDAAYDFARTKKIGEEGIDSLNNLGEEKRIECLKRGYFILLAAFDEFDAELTSHFGFGDKNTRRLIRLNALNNNGGNGSTLKLDPSLSKPNDSKVAPHSNSNMINLGWRDCTEQDIGPTTHTCVTGEEIIEIDAMGQYVYATNRNSRAVCRLGLTIEQQRIMRVLLETGRSLSRRELSKKVNEGWVDTFHHEQEVVAPIEELVKFLPGLVYRTRAGAHESGPIMYSLDKRLQIHDDSE